MFLAISSFMLSPSLCYPEKNLKCIHFCLHTLQLHILKLFAS